MRTTAPRSTGDPNYEGGFLLDRLLTEVAGIIDNEDVHIQEVTRGTRLKAYVPAGYWPIAVGVDAAITGMAPETAGLARIA